MAPAIDPGQALVGHCESHDSRSRGADHCGADATIQNKGSHRVMNYEGIFKKCKGCANLISQWLRLSNAAGANEQRVKLAVFSWQFRNGAQKLRGKRQDSETVKLRG